MPDISYLASRGSYEEFLAQYEPGQATSWTEREQVTLLHDAVSNSDVTARIAISNHLLDDGADASAIAMRERFTVLHMLFRGYDHDFQAEAPLLERLPDAGADINHVAGGNWGTPIQTLGAQGVYTDEALAPFYDVIFARPDLDLLKPGKKGRSSLDSARLFSPRRADLLARMQTYLRAQGSEVPPA